ncbi:hypothetical protein N7463_000755 [Penicillium fimorum]|uniref:Uncharacterized protein n=1 Tax=Penicillium fimorum TaxID=1882269 RepID=A0A9X0CBT6_9EURO|nr:hypothetical protein N7463_000755 [Penicillium fimorum]
MPRFPIRSLGDSESEVLMDLHIRVTHWIRERTRILRETRFFCVAFQVLLNLPPSEFDPIRIYIIASLVIRQMESLNVALMSLFVEEREDANNSDRAWEGDM